MLQPADRPQCNQRLKRIIKRVLRRSGVRRKLKNEFGKVNHNSLTANTRKEISKVLAETMKIFNSDPNAAKGIKNAFRETVMPGNKRHSELRALLEQGRLVPACDPPPPKRARHFCSKCGESWASKSQKGAKNHYATLCWYNRPDLLPPLITTNATSMNSVITPGIVAVFKSKDDEKEPEEEVFLGKDKQHLFEIKEENWIPKPYETQFWNDHTKSLKYSVQ